MKAFIEEVIRADGHGNYHVFGAKSADDLDRKFTQCFTFNTNPEFDQRVWAKELAFKQAMAYAKRVEDMTTEKRTIVYETPKQ